MAFIALSGVVVADQKSVEDGPSPVTVRFPTASRCVFATHHARPMTRTVLCSPRLLPDFTGARPKLFLLRMDRTRLFDVALSPYPPFLVSHSMSDFLDLLL